MYSHLVHEPKYLTKYIPIHVLIHHNTSCDTSQYLYDVLGCIALPLHDQYTGIEVLGCIVLTIHDQYTEINLSNDKSPIQIVVKTEAWGTTSNTSIIP